jgi:hypothetical protein
VATPHTTKAHRSSRQRLAPSGIGPFWLTIIAGATVLGAWFAYGFYEERHVALEFTFGNEPTPNLELTFYPDQLAFTAPSPPPPLGQHFLDGGSSVVVGADLVPGHAVVKYSGDGVGTGLAFVQLGKSLSPIELRAEQSLSGRVEEPVGFWFLGWRNVGCRPVPNAEVIVMAGGEHGIDLATTTTDDEGRFTVSGFDGQLPALGLRVKAPGFEIVHESLEDIQQRPRDRSIILRTPAEVRRGKLKLNVDVALSSLRLLARGLPGVEASPAEDGTFELDHIPTNMEAKVVVYGLPDNCAQVPARTERGKSVTVTVQPGAAVSGRVFRADHSPIAGALVWVGDDPAVVTDSDGYYQLLRILPGDATVTAQCTIGKGSRARQLIGSCKVDLDSFSKLLDVNITMER